MNRMIPVRAAPALAWEGVVDEPPSWPDAMKDALWLAVPKRRTSYTRKRIRNAQKKPPRLFAWSRCSNCGEIKRQHHLCSFCAPGKVNSWLRSKGGVGFGVSKDEYAFYDQVDDDAVQEAAAALEEGDQHDENPR